MTNITPDGLLVQNVTKEGHIFYNGQVTRTLTREADNSWTVTTYGNGNNVTPGLNYINELTRPLIFEQLDRAMRQSIEANHAANKSWNRPRYYYFNRADVGAFGQFEKGQYSVI
jgi:hypothetical protein